MVNEKSTIVLMVQNAKRIFCYFNISPMTVKEFEDVYGENSWRNSKPILKLYEVENGIAKEIKNIFIDAFANNWYIDLEKGDLDLFVKLGRVLPDNTFAAFSVSNTVTTPREEQASDTAVCFVDVSKEFAIGSEVQLPKYNNILLKKEEELGREPKPYPFMELSKEIENYPKIKVKCNYYYSEFFDEYISDAKRKCKLNLKGE